MKKLKIFACILVFLILLSSSVLAVESINLNDAVTDSGNWVTGGSDSATSGNGVITFPGGGDGANKTWTYNKVLPLKDTWVSFNWTLDADIGGWPGFAVFSGEAEGEPFWEQSSTNGYFFCFKGAASDNIMEVQRVVDGASIIIDTNGEEASDSATIPNNVISKGTYLIEFGIFYSGSSAEIIVKVDGKEFVKVNDPIAPLMGDTKFYVYNCSDVAPEMSIGAVEVAPAPTEAQTETPAESPTAPPAEDTVTTPAAAPQTGDVSIFIMIALFAVGSVALLVLKKKKI